MRIADAQTTIGEVAALAALVQALVRLEAIEPLAPELLLDAAEVLHENRFLASRDGVSARLLDPVRETRVPVEEYLRLLLPRAGAHAHDLGCAAPLDTLGDLVARPGAGRQRTLKPSVAWPG